MLERLKRRRDFQRVTRARNSAGMPGLVLQACPQAAAPTEAAPQESAGRGDPGAAQPGEIRNLADAGDGNGVRIGFTASKKVGNAVARNRAKRRLRALVEDIMPMHAMPGQDYVLIARNTTGERPFAALRSDLERALKRLNLWQDRDDPPTGATIKPSR